MLRNIEMCECDREELEFILKELLKRRGEVIKSREELIEENKALRKTVIALSEMLKDEWKR